MLDRTPVDFSRLDDYRPDITNPGAQPIMAYVLFMDIVGFTRMPMDRQRATVTDLQSLVFATPPYVEAEAGQNVICRPTGDGMALVFFNTLLAPARCAMEVAQQLKHNKHIRLRMGIHSGHVYRVQDALGNSDVIGEGINTAQRVMDCGDIGHILLSREAAALLQNLQDWREWVQDLGPCPVKHGQMVHLYNLNAGDIGNKHRPKKISTHRRGEVKAFLDPRRYLKAAILAGAVGIAWQFGPTYYPSVSETAKSAWFSIFTGGLSRKLERSALFAAERKWKESISEAKSVLISKSSTPDQRAESYYRIVSGYYHLGSLDKVAKAAKAYKKLAAKLPNSHWTGGALRWETALFSARSAAAKREWASASARALEVTTAANSRPEQRAEAYYLLALGATKRGNAEQAYQFGIKYDQIAPKIPAGHWTRKMMDGFTDKPVVAAAQTPTNEPAEPPQDPVQIYYQRVQSAFARGDSAAAARELKNLDRYREALSPEQLADLRKIASAIDLSAARSEFEKKRYSAAVAFAGRVLDRIDRTPADDAATTVDRAKALYYLAASHLRAGNREKAQRCVEIFGDRCASLGPDHPWSQRIAAVQAAILNSIPTDPLAQDSFEETAADSTDSP